MKTEHILMFCECTNFLACSKMSVKRITKCIGGLSVSVRCEIMLSVSEGKTRCPYVCVCVCVCMCIYICCMLQNVEVKGIQTVEHLA